MSRLGRDSLCPCIYIGNRRHCRNVDSRLNVTRRLPGESKRGVAKRSSYGVVCGQSQIQFFGVSINVLPSLQSTQHPSCAVLSGYNMLPSRIDGRSTHLTRAGGRGVGFNSIMTPTCGAHTFPHASATHQFVVCVQVPVMQACVRR